jgi:hypothetical protein
MRATRERATNESVRTLTLFVRIHGRIAADNESVLVSTIHPDERPNKPPAIVNMMN